MDRRKYLRRLDERVMGADPGESLREHIAKTAQPAHLEPLPDKGRLERAGGATVTLSLLRLVQHLP
jgi:hypothetical protein